jgi:hypothetical protein
MAFTPLYACGFETGLYNEYVDTLPGNCGITTDPIHSGTYSFSSYWARNIVHTMTENIAGELYGGMWIYRGGNIQDELIFAIGNSTLSIVFPTASQYSSVTGLGGGAVAGTHYLTNGAWHLLQYRITVDGSTGVFQVYWDGILDIDYTGDTLPGTGNNFASITLYCPDMNVTTQIDDIVYGTGGFPGDLRIESLMLNSDISNEWTISTGSVAYGALDEIPANTTDYITATGSPFNNKISSHGHNAWTSASKIPRYVNVTNYIWQDSVSTTTGVSFTDTSGSTVRTSASVIPTTTATFYSNILTTVANGSVWSASAIDNMNTGVVAVIPV